MDLQDVLTARDGGQKAVQTLHSHLGVGAKGVEDHADVALGLKQRKI